MFNVVLNCADDRKLFLGLSTDVDDLKTAFCSEKKVSCNSEEYIKNREGSITNCFMNMDTNLIDNNLLFEDIVSELNEYYGFYVYKKNDSSYSIVSNIKIDKTLMIDADGNFNPNNLKNKVIEFNVPELIIE